MSCRIFIKDENGQTRTVNVNSEEMKNMTVEEFIRRSCPKYERGTYRYIFNGKQLEDDRTLGSYGIKDGCTIHRIIPLRGGYLPPPEDEDKGMTRTESMEVLASMQQTEADSRTSCCML